ncbi:MAG TPA: SDR family NAD(P)-dependent oxidoreductase [Minicystis sp.]|nr:SDR family NAD(P)-dependent oxidoreductase [Minicystis sp.]
MDLGLGGKVALVTGGSEGIGRAAALSLAREGAKVVVVARRADVLAAAAEALAGESGSEVAPVAADVSTPDGVEHAVRATVERFGRLDVLVNNAGTSRALPFEKATDEIWQQDLDLKVFAAIRAARLAIPHLRAAGGGVILNQLSITAKQPPAASVPTSVSRAAGMALTKVLSKELAADKIRVNALLIGLVKAGQHEKKWEAAGRPGTLDDFYAHLAKQRDVPLGRVADAHEAGDFIAFLCSPRASYETGVAINFDGGTSSVV